MTQQQQDILNEAIDVCQNEMQANNPNLPRMTFACRFALASMLSVLKMEGEDDNDMVTIDEMMECAVMNYLDELPEDKRKDVIERLQRLQEVCRNKTVIYVQDEECDDLA